MDVIRDVLSRIKGNVHFMNQMIIGRMTEEYKESETKKERERERKRERERERERKIRHYSTNRSQMTLKTKEKYKQMYHRIQTKGLTVYRRYSVHVHVQ